VLLNESPPFLPHLSSRIPVTKNPKDAVRQPLVISGWYEKSSGTVSHQVGHTSHVGGNNRDAAGHGFQHDAPQSLRKGGEDEKLGPVQPIADLGLRKRSQETDPFGQSGLVRLLLEPGSQRAFSDYISPGPRFLLDDRDHGSN
jgi:hypothetical protein